MTASFDASRTSFVREGSFRANSSSSQQGSSSERDDKLQDKKKGVNIVCAYSLMDPTHVMLIKFKTELTIVPLLLQTNPLSCQPCHLALPPHQRGQHLQWSVQNLAGLTPSPAATRPLSNWCVKAHSGDSQHSARRTLPLRGSCRSASTTCHPHCNAKLTSRQRTLVS